MESDFTFGILGGTGQMGRWFEKLLQDQGHRVLVSGRRTELTPEEMARQSHVVVLSLPLPAALAAAETLGPLLAPDSLLMDLCSLKAEVCRKMEASTRAEVVGCHPLFGPAPESLSGQNVVLCPVRGRNWAGRLSDLFTRAGAEVQVCDPVAHDRKMALVQAVNHFITITLARTLHKMDLHPEEILPFSTPLFRLKLSLVGRLFAQDVRLYRDLISENPFAGDMLDRFMETAGELSGLFSGNRGDEAERLLGEVREFLGGFCETGKRKSDGCLKALDEKPGEG
ncbi:MAG: prephenate dehydrogenase/arogenate dehydrogenase family protein [Pseudomonadota bacterium]